jgi:hypothetical protein
MTLRALRRSLHLGNNGAAKVESAIIPMDIGYQ